MKLGNILETIFKYTGVKWLVKLIVVKMLGYESCGCERRRDALNDLLISRKDD